MHLPEPEPARRSAYGAKRDAAFMEAWLELCAEIAAVSDLEDWNALSGALEDRMSLMPIAWVDVARNELLAVLARLEAP